MGPISDCFSRGNVIPTFCYLDCVCWLCMRATAGGQSFDQNEVDTWYLSSSNNPFLQDLTVASWEFFLNLIIKWEHTLPHEKSRRNSALSMKSDYAGQKLHAHVSQFNLTVSNYNWQRSSSWRVLFKSANSRRINVNFNRTNLVWRSL